MKLGCTGGVLRLAEDRRESLRIAREMGCQGVEVGLNVAGLRTGAAKLDALVAEAKALREDFASAGVEVLSLTPGILLKHAEHPEVIEGVCRVAEALGTRLVRLMFGPHVRWGGPGSKLDPWMAECDGSRHSREWLRHDADHLETMLELSADHDVRYAFELHHGYTVNSASAAMRLLEPYAPDRVGIIMDPGNMVIEGNEGWRNSVQIMGEYLAYVHCKNVAFRHDGGRWTHELVDLADGIASYPELVTILKDEDFGGFLCSEEMRKGDYAGRVRHELAYLKGLIESDERVMPS